MTTGTRVRQLRVVLRVEDFDGALAYYRDALGLAEAEAVAGPGARLAILEAGRATLELADPVQVEHIDSVETDGVTSTPVRLALEVGDAAEAAQAAAGAGATLLAPPVRTPWGSLNARLEGPGGVQVTLFAEAATRGSALEDAERLVGSPLDALGGGERGALARTVALARDHGAAGGLPFAAFVVRDGKVIGAGVNTTLADHDPSAHGEVAAIRDATRRTGASDLAGAIVYSSCEPCAICRTVAHAARASEIVYAAAATLVPTELASMPETGARLAGAVSAVLPGIARAGESGLSPDELAAPFQAYLAAAAAQREPA